VFEMMGEIAKQISSVPSSHKAHHWAAPQTASVIGFDGPSPGSSCDVPASTWLVVGSTPTRPIATTQRAWREIARPFVFSVVIIP